MRKRVTLLFFFGTILLSVTQAQYNKGYIVTLDKDTIKGFLRNIPEMDYARSVQFKPKRKGTDPIIFTADEIEGFYLYPNLNFRAFISPLPKDSMSHVFIERLYQGRLNIYLLDLSAIPLYFVQKNEGPLRQLVRQKRSHMTLLGNLTSDSETAIMSNFFPLTSSGLIRFAQRYEEAMHKQEARKTRN